MKLVPLKDQVIVKRKEAEKKVAGGLIHVPENAQKDSVEAEVLAVGPGRVLENGTKVPVDVKVGDIVLLAKYGGNEVEVEGQKYLIIKEDNILAVLNNE